MTADALSETTKWAKLYSPESATSLRSLMIEGDTVFNFVAGMNDHAVGFGKTFENFGLQAVVAPNLHGLMRDFSSRAYSVAIAKETPRSLVKLARNVVYINLRLVATKMIILWREPLRSVC